MRRATVLLAAMLLVPSAVAGQEETPAAEIFAPDDLAFLLPARLGGVLLAIEDVPADEMTEMLLASRPENYELFRTMLLDLGKEPSDMSGARALAPVGGPRYDLTAMRLAGVDGMALLTVLLTASAPPDVDLETTRAMLSEATWTDSGGRQLVSGEDGAATTFTVFYSKGEVLFMVRGADGLTMAEVLAALP